jgi:hypothetical protein
MPLTNFISAEAVVSADPAGGAPSTTKVARIEGRVRRQPAQANGDGKRPGIAARLEREQRGITPQERQRGISGGGRKDRSGVCGSGVAGALTSTIG